MICVKIDATLPVIHLSKQTATLSDLYVTATYKLGKLLPTALSIGQPRFRQKRAFHAK